MGFHPTLKQQSTKAQQLNLIKLKSVYKYSKAVLVLNIFEIAKI